MLEFSEESIGVKFGSWTIIAVSHRPSDKAKKEFLCRCECGAEKLMRRHRIERGERMACTECRAAASLYRDRLWKVWDMMHRRCEIPGTKAFGRYGGRGIYVCREWKMFDPFYRWAMANGYQPGQQLDRINNDGPYSSTNCQYVTRIANCNNRRDNHLITAFGESKTLSGWSRDERCRTNIKCLEQRINKLGWIPEKAISTLTR